MRVFQTAVLAVVASAAVILGSPSHAQTEFMGAGETSELACDREGATVEGASNVLIITGSCTNLKVIGAGNRIRIDLAENATLRIEGADNEIRWRTRGAGKPRLSIVGAGNRIARER